MTAEVKPIIEPGGYDYTFVDTPPDRLVCKICHLPSRDPHLTDCCGTIFCKSCLERARQATTVSTACAHCRAEKFDSMINKQADREIKSLHIYCTNKEKGCEWQGELNDINNHLGNSDGCQFEEVKCSNECGKMIERRYLTSHVETECPHRKVNCQYCHDTGEHQFIEGQHKEECPKLPLPCPNKCEVESVPREDMEAHLTSCHSELTHCEYHNMGCKIMVARKDQEKHKKEKMEDHLMMTQAKLVEFEDELSAVKMDAEEKIDGLTKTTRSLHQKLVASEQTLDTIQVQLNAEFKEMQDKQQQKIDRLEVMLNQLTVQLQHNQWLLQLHALSISGDKTCPVTVRVSEVEDKKIHSRKWHSDPFYTYEKGYRMSVRVLVNGTDKVKGTHMSVYLYLMKGQYDGNLQWPLRGAFQIALLNQKMDGGHYINDYNTVKFIDKTPAAITNRVIGKQSDEMAHEGLGRNEFIKHEDLKKETDTCQYLKDDCIFLRIHQI